MPDSKITALTSISTSTDPANDPLVIVDVSDTSMAATGTTKKVTLNQLLGASGTATLASATITGDLTVRSGNKLKLFRSDNAVSTDFSDSGSGIGLTVNNVNGDGIRLQLAGTTIYSSTSTATQNWLIGGSTAMTLNATGLGVGQVPSTSKLEVGITNTSTAGLIEANALKIENNNATVNNAAGLFLSQTGNAGCGIAGIATSRTGGSRSSALALYYYSQATSASPIEGARLDASGNLLVGTTNTNPAYNAVNGIAVSPTFLSVSNTSGIAGAFNRNTDGIVLYFTRNGTAVGNVSVTTGGTTFNSTSDYRLKESISPLVGGLARVNALKPSIYKWKSDGSNGEGFLAHELAEVVPLAVTGQKDAVKDDGSIEAQGVDLSRVVPILVAAIQELAAEVNALKNA